MTAPKRPNQPALTDLQWAEVLRQLAEIERGSVELHTREDLVEKLARSVRTGRPLRVKAGFDPTAPDLHLGHTVILMKMRRFQELGHQAIFLIGDFTGRIGDPTGKKETRPMLTEAELARNADTYRQQVFKILDPERTEVRFNSKWFAEMGAEGMVRLAASMTVARMLERDDFKKRYQDGQPIAIHEFLYPLVQGYDSVALKADVELGGTDQLFNLLVGRALQREAGQEPQVVITNPLLEGLDAKVVDGVLTGAKMSKSAGNYVGIQEDPEVQFGKLMSVSDELMWRYYELCTDIAPETLREMRQLVTAGRLHPKKAKEGLAMRIIADFHGEDAARQAREEFERVFARKGVPDRVSEFTVPLEEGKVFVPRLLVRTALASSNSEALRLLRQGAVRVDGRKLDAETTELEAQPGQTILLKVGKRRFARVRFE